MPLHLCFPSLFSPLGYRYLLLFDINCQFGALGGLSWFLGRESGELLVGSSLPLVYLGDRWSILSQSQGLAFMHSCSYTVWKQVKAFFFLLLFYQTRYIFS